LHVEIAGPIHSVVGYDVLVDLLVGIGMVTIVLEDSRVQIQRLDALNAITQQISGSRDFESTVSTLMDEIIRLTRAKAAWFRTLRGDKLALAAHRGVSDSFTQKVATIETAKSVGGFALRESEVYVVRASEVQSELRQAVADEGIHHLLLVPVEGKG